jgi:fimbrial chaperone protein
LSARTLCLAGCALALIANLGAAADLSVSPTSLALGASERIAALTVMSGGPERARGQVRVMRWHNQGGRNDLEPTREVTASPPSLNLAAQQEITIRLLRKSNRPVRGQECYRVLIDILPDLTRDRPLVSFTVRHSVPLCFGKKP